MKLKLSFFMLFAFANCAKAQFALLPTVNDIASYSDPSTTMLIVSDTLRGGHFFLYTGSDNADDGMIFLDSDGNKWLRQTDGTGVINSRWYGIRNGIIGYTDLQNDMWDKIQAAQNYIWAHKNLFSTLLIPRDTSGYAPGYIFMSKADTIKNALIIEGTGVSGTPYPIFEFYDQKGFYAPPLQKNGDGNFFGMKNIGILQYVNTYADTIHAINVMCLFNFENVVVSGASGDGLHVYAPGSSLGNADRSFLQNCEFRACNNGLYYEGADANIITAINCSFVSNRRWGVWDAGLLGNSFYSAHFSNNGKVAGYENVVQYPDSTTYWQCISDTGIVGKRPDLYPALWKQVTKMGGGVYNAGTTYFSGGPIHVSNINSRSHFYSTYSESFQPYSIITQSACVEGADFGTELLDNDGTGIFYYGDKIIIQGNITVPALSNGSPRQINFGGNTPRADATVTIDAAGSFDALALRTASSGAWIHGINGSSSTGYFGYLNDTWVTYAGNVSVHTTSPTEFKPSYDSVTDLGLSNFRWKNIYGTKFYGDGSNLTGVGNNRWSLTGNAGINPVSNYLGTSDSKALRINTNGINAIFIDSSNQHVGLGTQTPTEKLTVYNGNIKIATPVIGNAEFDFGTLASTYYKIFYNDATGNTTYLSMGYDHIFSNGTTALEILRLKANGNVGIQNNTPTALLHIGAGSASANTAPVKRTAGSLNTTAEAGTQEYNGSSYETKGSGLRYALGGTIMDFYSDANNSGTGETDLYSYTTPASTLASTGEKLQAIFRGTFNDVTATGQLQVYFAGTNIANTGMLTISSIGGWSIKISIIRSGTSTARAIVDIITPTASTPVYTMLTDLTGLTFTNSNILKITGTAGGSTGGSGDITSKLGTISWWGAAN